MPPSERGAALLAVLVLVAIMGAIAAGAFERLRYSSALALNGAALDQARAFALGIEDLMTLRADDIASANPGFTTLEGGWNGATRQLPLPGGGLAQATIRDGGNCFNLNGLVESETAGVLRRREAGVVQFVALMHLLGVPETEARRVAGAAADWADGDSLPSPDGAEDSVYAALETPYRPGNTLFADPSELRAVAGMTPELYRRLRPWLCALPVAEPSPINVNTLGAEQAPLIAMLSLGGARLEAVQLLLSRRPARGWETMEEFWRGATASGLEPSFDRAAQLKLRTDWFALDLVVSHQGGEVEEGALIDARQRPARVVARRWGAGE